MGTVKDPPPISVTAASPSGSDGRTLLAAYFEELISRYQHRPGRAEEVEAAMSDYPSHDLVAPKGAFLVARRGSTPVGCVGLRVRPNRVGEVTRVFVLPAERRRGIGTRLLGELETVARAYNIRRLALDTRDDLVEARRLYLHCGFEEVPAFNGRDYAEHWFAKYLDE
jgi:GNAT superfamily N-acetyltransferase